MSALIPAPAADPWMISHNGHYFYCESRNQTTIHVRKAPGIFEIADAENVKVWAPPTGAANSKNVWAPELHFIEGKWYIYYAADDGKNENHRMWVLEAETDDPQGPYHCKGMLDTQGWAIDGTLLEANGKRYMVWSGWPGVEDGQQNLYLAPMSNPWTLAEKRTLLASPTEAWEKNTMAICEGPQVLKRNGKTFIIYSASASWTIDYCLGMIVLDDEADVMKPASWRKIAEAPVFEKTTRIWGVGHCSFVKSPCQTEDWIVYHAKSKRKKGWDDRHVHTQRFSWHNDHPVLGIPSPETKPTRVLTEVIRPAPTARPSSSTVLAPLAV